MLNRIRALLLTATAMVLLTGPAAAQGNRVPIPRDTNITHVLHLIDGSVLVGKLIDRDSITVRFATNGGTLTVPVARVKELREVTAAEVRGNEYWFPDANETRLFFAPTGRMLKKGDGYYSNTYLLLQNFVGAPSDRLTLGGGFSIVPSDNFVEDNIYYLTPKLGVYNTPKTNIAVGALAAMVPGSGVDGQTFGILYAVGTRGGADGSITGGIGYGYEGGKLQDRPLVLLGGAARVSRRVSLVTENYLTWRREATPDLCANGFCSYRERTVAKGVMSYGLRFMGEKISTDFALWNYSEEFIFPGIPYVAFAVKF